MNTPKQTAAGYIDTGAGKAAMAKGRMFLLAVLAGAFIALAGVGSVIGTAQAGKLAGACIFPAGLAMVVLAGSELFTGNNLMVISLLAKKITAGQLLLAWAVVYIGNFVGAAAVAALSVWAGAFDGAYETLIAAAQAKVALSFGQAVLRGALCNMLVCTAVWMSMAAKDAAGKVLALYLPIMLFVVCGFEHSIANMFYIPAGLLAARQYGADPGALGIGAFLVKNLLPVTLGNLLGGAGLGALLYAIYLRPDGSGKDSLPKTPAEKLSKKENALQAVKFTLFSISAGVIQAVTFALLHELTDLPYWPAYLIALTLSVLWNFTLNRSYTFKSAANVPVAMAKVFGFYCVFTPLSTWWGDALTKAGWPDYLVLALTMIANFVLEFLFCRLVVYRGTINTNQRAKKQAGRD